MTVLIMPTTIMTHWTVTTTHTTIILYVTITTPLNTIAMSHYDACYNNSIPLLHMVDDCINNTYNYKAIDCYNTYDNYTVCDYYNSKYDFSTILTINSNVAYNFITIHAIVTAT